MVRKESRQEIRVKKHMKIRNRFSGTAQRPRLAVFRSNNHMYAQIIDDSVGHTLVAASTVEKEIKAELENTDTVDAAAYVGTVIAKRALEMLNIPAEGSKIITCHIGNGASVAAVKDGKSVDTSMGMTPLAGLMMGTRSGDVDPGIFPYVMEKTGLDMQGMIDMLNKKSGVAGITGNA